MQLFLYDDYTLSEDDVISIHIQNGKVTYTYELTRGNKHKVVKIERRKNPHGRVYVKAKVKRLWW